MRTEVNQRVKESTSLKELETLIEQNQDYFGENPGADLVKEKQKFDEKLEKGRFATIVKRQQYYKDLIASLEKADTHMKKTIEDATSLMNRVVVVDQEVELKTETITKSIIDDTIMFDLEEKQVESRKEQEMAQTLNVDEMGDCDILQQQELSFLSANVSANSCYF